MEYQISAFLPKLDLFRIGIGVQRQLKNFSDRDKEVITSLVPHIFQAYTNAREFTEAKSGVREVERALVAHRQGFIHLRADGRINSMSGNCGEWLRSYCPVEVFKADRLPDLLQS